MQYAKRYKSAEASSKSLIHIARAHSERRYILHKLHVFFGSLLPKNTSSRTLLSLIHLQSIPICFVDELDISQNDIDKK